MSVRVLAVILITLTLTFTLAPAAFSEDCVSVESELHALLRKQSVDSAAYKKLAEHCPSNYAVWYNYGVALQDNNEIEAAKLAFQKARTLDDRLEVKHALASMHRRLKEFEESEKLYRNILEGSPEHIRSLQGLALTLGLMERYAEARSLLQQALKIDPEDANLYYNMGALEKKEKNYKQARVYLDKALELQPAFEEARLHVGLMLQEEGRFQESITPLKMLAESNSSVALPAKRALGRAYQELKDYSAAIFWWRKAMRQDAKHLPSVISLAESYVLNQQSHVGKELLVRHADMKDQSLFAYYKALAWCEMELGEFLDARNHLEKARAIDSSDEEVNKMYQQVSLVTAE